MHMKKLGLIAAMALGGLVAGSSIATAQDNAPPPPPKKGRTVEQQLERMTTALTLTDDQKPKVKAVLEASVEKMRGIRDLPEDQRATKRQEVRDEESKKFKDILTPDQFEKWQGMAQKRGKKAPPSNSTGQ